MSIDKAMTTAPMGIGSLQDGFEPVEIIVSVEGEDGGDITPEDTTKKDNKFDENLAKNMDPGDLGMLASDLLTDYETDVRDRADWLDTYIKGLKLLGLKHEERTEPWKGASGVTHPLLMEAATKFQAEAMMEVFPAMGPVKTVIIGKETDDKSEAAIRVAADMNYQLTEVMSEYRPEHEKMLLSLCLSGNAFKKIHFDPSIGRQVAPFIPAEDVVVPYGASSIESADRVTHRMRKTKNELRKLQVAGFYCDVDLGEPMRVFDDVEKQRATEQGFNASFDDRFQILEMHVNYDLPGYEDKDKIALPYVITIEKGTQTVLAIRRNWLEDDEFKLRRQHFVHYGYIPGFSFYYFGLIHLIGGHARAATSLLRQLIDAGTLSNLPGGLKARGLRVKGDDTPIKPGEFRDVDLPSGSIKDNILPLPYKEPSQVLLALMNQVIGDGQRFAAVADLQVSDMSAQSPVGTTLAILERVLKVMSAVHARIHYTMKQEFKLLAAIIRDNTPQSYRYDPEVGDAGAKRGDYDLCEVIPVSDPNASTMAQRVVQYQAVLQLSQSAPQIYDLAFLHRQMVETLGIKNPNKVIPDKDDQKPMDPVSENMAILMGKPAKAFLAQDHEAHLTVHMAAMQDPKMQAIIMQNPQAPALIGAGHAHVMEHVAYQYRKEIEKQMGVSLPAPPDFDADDDDDDTQLPPELENQIAALSAQAASKLLQKDKQEAQAAQAAQQQKDPLIQMQQQELQIRQQEVQIKQMEAQLKQQQAQIKNQLDQAEQQRKTKKDMVDAAAKADEHAFKEKQLAAEQQLAGAKLGVEIKRSRTQQQIDAATAADKHQLEESKHEFEGAKLGVEIAKDHAGRHTDLRKHASGLNTQLHTDEQGHAHAADQQREDHAHKQEQAQKDREHAAELSRIAARNKPKPGSK